MGVGRPPDASGDCIPRSILGGKAWGIRVGLTNQMVKGVQDAEIHEA
jgi:hypothetical protein